MRAIDVSTDVIAEIHAEIERTRVFRRSIGGDLDPAPPPPDSAILGDLIRQAFWASLSEEEGHSTTFVLHWLAEPLSDPFLELVLAEPIPLTPENIRKLAPVLVRGAALAASTGPTSDGVARIVGVSYGGTNSLVIRVPRPGLIAVFHGGWRVAIIRGGELHSLGNGLPDPAQLIGDTLPGRLNVEHRSVAGAFLLALSRSMSHHGNGGTLVFLSGSPHYDLPRQIEQPVRLASPIESLAPLFTISTHAVRESIDKFLGGHRESIPGLPGFPDEAFAAGLALTSVAYLYSAIRGEWHSDFLYKDDVERATGQRLRQVVTAVGKLTARDGAVVLDNELCVRAFGAHLTGAQPERLLARSILNRRPPEPRALYEGTRHASAVGFVNKVTDAVAIVASHDGPLTLCHWDPNAGEGGGVVAVCDLHLLLD